MPLIVLTFVIQACFIYHVFKTGRPYWWAFVILSLPVAGCIIYYFVEVFPGSREHRAANRAARDLSTVLNPDRELKRRMEALEIAPTVENRVALAQEFLRFGRVGEAIELYRECRVGPHAGDPELIFGLARAYLLNQDFGPARELLDELQTQHKSFRMNEVALVRAQALEGLGDTSAALEEYERLAIAAVGLEAKIRYGQLLKRLGYLTQSDNVFREAITHAERFKMAHEEEREWVSVAKRELSQS
jgi:hypothetical protein